MEGMIHDSIHKLRALGQGDHSLTIVGMVTSLAPVLGTILKVVMPGLCSALKEASRPWRAAERASGLTLDPKVPGSNPGPGGEE